MYNAPLAMSKAAQLRRRQERSGALEPRRGAKWGPWTASEINVADIKHDLEKQGVGRNHARAS
jgi:hypothetical protein